MPDAREEMLAELKKLKALFAPFGLPLYLGPFIAQAERLNREIERLREALAELVRLKALKERAESSLGQHDPALLLGEYEAKKPTAWAAARAALEGGEDA